MSKSHKAKRRKLFHSVESLESLNFKKPKETQQERLDRIGYKKESEYEDCVGYLAW